MRNEGKRRRERRERKDGERIKKWEGRNDIEDRRGKEKSHWQEEGLEADRRPKS